MTANPARRGAAAVGWLADLDPVEAGAVRCLRLWSDGEETRRMLRRELSEILGDRQGETAADSLDSICTLCALHGRRPLMRHAAACPSLGADECCFATFVAAAASGDREDAMLMAALLVRADLAPGLVEPAERLALALRRMSLLARRAAARPEHLH